MGKYREKTKGVNYMITAKQRAQLRGIANTMAPVMQIGKEGISENSLIQINGLFESRELFKINVLKNCDASPKELANQIEKETNCEIVQCIGSKIVLYRKSTKKNFKHIELV